MWIAVVSLPQPGILRILAVTRVNHTDRPRFESFVAAQSGLSGTIRDMTTVRSMLGTQPSANRSSYLAVQYSEMPLAPEYEAVMSGLDASPVEYVCLMTWSRLLCVLMSWQHYLR